MPSGAPERWGRPIGIAVGADSELWQGGLGGAIGPYGGVRVVIRGGWSLALLGGASWGLGSAEGIRAVVLRGVLELDDLLLPQVAIGLGIAVRDLHADAGASGALDGTTVGLVVSARYVLRIGRALAVQAGPRLEALAQPLVVLLNGEEVFRIPRFVAGLAVEGSGDFGG